MNLCHEYARLFAILGIAVIPLRPKSKAPAVQWTRYQSLLPTEYELRQWSSNPFQNYGVIAGWKNLVILDFDAMEWYNLWLLWINDIQTDDNIRQVASRAFRVKTNRGMHVYFTVIEHAKNERRCDAIDIQARGKYVVSPLSIHPLGSVYEPLIGEDGIAFPQVPNIEYILPSEYFPVFAPKISATRAAATVPRPRDAPPVTEYDPWEAIDNPPTSLITTIKRRFRIEDFYPDRKKSSNDGRWYIATCPFHDDNTPSAWIDVNTQYAGCNSTSCPAHYERRMDVINAYARIHKLHDRDAIRAMQKLL